MKDDREPLLKVEHLSRSFSIGKGKLLKAVEDVSIQIQEGECLAIVGESGCGKSTLARMISGILPADSGRMEFLGRDITHQGYEEWRQLRKSIQFIFQDPMDAFSPRMRIGTFLCEPYVNYKICSKREAVVRAAALLEKVELKAEYMDKYPHQLSGGELQRVVIARALALHPRLLICDEITSALDVSTQQQIMGLLKKLQETERIAFLFISHDLALVQNFSDRIAVMYLGSVVEQIEARKLLERVHPYTKALLDSVFSVHMNGERQIHVLEGDPPNPMDIPVGCTFYSRCRLAQPECRTTRPQLTQMAPGHQAACVNR